MDDEASASVERTEESALDSDGEAVCSLSEIPLDDSRDEPEVEKAESAVPWRPTAALALCQASHSWTLGSLFSYAGLLCVDLRWADDEDSAGYVAGYLAGALTFGRIFTSVLWGKAADAYGVRLQSGAPGF